MPPNPNEKPFSFFGLLKETLISSTETIRRARLEAREKFPDMFDPNEKPMIETGECEVLCFVCSKPLGDAFGTCLCLPPHGSWHRACDPHERKENWWWRYLSFIGDSEVIYDEHVPLVIAESTRRARLEMAREMKGIFEVEKEKLTKWRLDSSKPNYNMEINDPVIVGVASNLDRVIYKIDSIIQEESSP